MSDRRPWDDTRPILLAGASAASSAATDLVEAARMATGANFTRPNRVETLTMLVDALRLAIEAGEDPDDGDLLAALETWMADHG